MQQRRCRLSSCRRRTEMLSESALVHEIHNWTYQILNRHKRPMQKWFMLINTVGSCIPLVSSYVVLLLLYDATNGALLLVLWHLQFWVKNIERKFFHVMYWKVWRVSKKCIKKYKCVGFYFERKKLRNKSFWGHIKKH